jgi:hypothetical protein
MLLQRIQLVASEARVGSPKEREKSTFAVSNVKFRQGATEVGCGERIRWAESIDCTKRVGGGIDAFPEVGDGG